MCRGPRPNFYYLGSEIGGGRKEAQRVTLADVEKTILRQVVVKTFSTEVDLKEQANDAAWRFTLAGKDAGEFQTTVRDLFSLVILCDDYMCAIDSHAKSLIRNALHLAYIFPLCLD